MTGQRTGVFTARRSVSLASQLTLLTVDARTDLVWRLSDLVTVPLTPVVPTRQTATTLPTAGCRLGGVTGPGGGLVASWTGDAHRVGAGGTGSGLCPVLRTFLLPGPGWPGSGVHPDPDILVTGGGAGVGAGEQLGALLSAGRTGAGVTEMWSNLTVVTLRPRLAQLLTPRPSHRLLSAAGDLELGLTTVTGHTHCQLAGITGSGVTSEQQKIFNILTKS